MVISNKYSDSEYTGLPYCRISNEEILRIGKIVEQRHEKQNISIRKGFERFGIGAKRWSHFWRRYRKMKGK